MMMTIKTRGIMGST